MQQRLGRAVVADLERVCARLREKPQGARRVALLLADCPDRDNGTGGGMPASAVAILSALAEAAYSVTDAPPDGAALIERLPAAPSEARPWAETEETLGFADYSAFFSALPIAVQKAVEERWGAAETDPYYRPGRVDCGRFAIPGFRCGNVAVMVEPARGTDRGAAAAWHDPALVPPHSWLAAYAWLARDFAADAVVYIGEHLSVECFPEAAFARPAPPLAHILRSPGGGGG